MEEHTWPESSKPTPKHETTVSWRGKFKTGSESCFEGEYLHKYVKLEKKFDTHEDFLQALKDGAFEDVLKNDKRYDGIQFRVNVLTEKSIGCL